MAQPRPIIPPDAQITARPYRHEATNLFGMLERIIRLGPHWAYRLGLGPAAKKEWEQKVAESLQGIHGPEAQQMAQAATQQTQQPAMPSGPPNPSGAALPATPPSAVQMMEGPIPGTRIRIPPDAEIKPPSRQGPRPFVGPPEPYRKWDSPQFWDPFVRKWKSNKEFARKWSDKLNAMIAEPMPPEAPDPMQNLPQLPGEPSAVPPPPVAMPPPAALPDQTARRFIPPDAQITAIPPGGARGPAAQHRLLQAQAAEVAQRNPEAWGNIAQSVPPMPPAPPGVQPPQPLGPAADPNQFLPGFVGPPKPPGLQPPNQQMGPGRQGPTGNLWERESEALGRPYGTPLPRQDQPEIDWWSDEWAAEARQMGFTDEEIDQMRKELDRNSKLPGPENQAVPEGSPGFVGPPKPPGLQPPELLGPEGQPWTSDQAGVVPPEVMQDMLEKGAAGPPPPPAGSANVDVTASAKKSIETGQADKPIQDITKFFGCDVKCSSVAMAHTIAGDTIREYPGLYTKMSGPEATQRVIDEVGNIAQIVHDRFKETPTQAELRKQERRERIGEYMWQTGVAGLARNTGYGGYQGYNGLGNLGSTVMAMIGRGMAEKAGDKVEEMKQAQRDAMADLAQGENSVARIRAIGLLAGFDESVIAAGTAFVEAKHMDHGYLAHNAAVDERMKVLWDQAYASGARREEANLELRNKLAVLEYERLAKLEWEQVKQQNQFEEKVGYAFLTSSFSSIDRHLWGSDQSGNIVNVNVGPTGVDPIVEGREGTAVDSSLGTIRRQIDEDSGYREIMDSRKYVAQNSTITVDGEDYELHHDAAAIILYKAAEMMPDGDEKNAELEKLKPAYLQAQLVLGVDNFRDDAERGMSAEEIASIMQERGMPISANAANRLLVALESKRAVANQILKDFGSDRQLNSSADMIRFAFENDPFVNNIMGSPTPSPFPSSPQALLAIGIPAQYIFNFRDMFDNSDRLWEYIDIMAEAKATGNAPDFSSTLPASQSQALTDMQNQARSRFDAMTSQINKDNTIRRTNAEVRAAYDSDFDALMEYNDLRHRFSSLDEEELDKLSLLIAFFTFGAGAQQ